MQKLISFDIWDTILKRKCHPEEIKLATARYLYLKYEQDLKEKYKDIYEILKKRDEIEEEICIESEEKGFDKECRILDVFQRLTKEIMKEEFSKEIAEELLKAEIEQEKRVIYLNPDILPIFEQYKELQMCCISDFYMGEKELQELLDFVGMPVKIEKIYSSADLLLNKRSGRLYQKAEEELEIKPEEHIHVGDNLYSDIEKAKELGIETISMKKEDMAFVPEKRRPFYFDFHSIKLEPTTMENRLFNVGVELSGLLYFFAYHIIEYAIKHHIDTVYYMTREGERFIKAHELIAKNNPFGVELPKAEIIEVSRMATFSASLKEFSIAELLRLWSQYRMQSMKALFKTLAINIEPYKEFLGKYDLTVEESIVEPWFDVRVQNLCRDTEFTSKIQVELDRKRKELLEYFSKRNIVNDDKPLFIVDIGWRGTIQDNLAYIFDQKQIGGYYITLYDYYNAQPKNTYKLKFIKDRDIIYNEVSSIITVLEMLFSSDTGSVIEYKEGEAIRKAKKEEVETVKKYVAHIQKGMLAGCEIINESMKQHPYQAEEFDGYINQIIRNIKTNPDKDLIEVYYNLVMNDTFGTGEYVEKKKGRLGTLDRVNIFKCRNKLRNEPWKEAYMKYNDIEYMNSIMNVKSVIRKVVGRK